MKKKIAVCLFVILAAVIYIGCQSNNTDNKDADNPETEHKIGVVVFNPDNPELRMFMNYYRDYIAAGFPVQFYFSDSVGSTEDEIAAIRKMKQEGVEGIISFYGLGVQDTVKVCEEEELYYILGSGTISEDDFNAVKSNEWFLGTIGPASDAEMQAGQDMAADFADKGASNYLIISAGAGMSNYMHLSRVEGMLETLGEKYGITYEAPVEELAAVTENTVVETGSEDVSITIAPGYIDSENGTANIKAALTNGSYDAVMAAAGIDSVLDELLLAEETSGINMRIGTVDCFSQENMTAFDGKDKEGNSQIDYVAGKYASMAGPAFAAMYNALEDDMDVIRPDGEAFRLVQGFWSASNASQYRELYDYTYNVYENAYSCNDLMSVIKAFDENADYEALKTLTESYDVESVKERIATQTKE